MSYALTISTIARCVYFYVVVLNEACPKHAPMVTMSMPASLSRSVTSRRSDRPLRIICDKLRRDYKSAVPPSNS